MAQPKLKSVEIYRPGGTISKYSAEEVVAAGVTPSGACIVVIRSGDKLTRFCGFPTVMHEEIPAVEVVSSPLVSLD